MTDERLAELRQDLAKASDEQINLKRAQEDNLRQTQDAATLIQRLQVERKTRAEPYKIATERVADLSFQILEEERRRAEEAEAARRAAKEAADSAAAPQPG